MKKIIFLLTVFFAFGLYGCNEANNLQYASSEIQISHKESDMQFKLTEEDTQTIVSLLNDGDWEDDVTKTYCDYIFEISNNSIDYSSEAGLFNDTVNRRHLVLSDEQKNYMESLLMASSNALATETVSTRQTENLAVGMTYEEFQSLHADVDFQKYRGYIFYVDADQNNIVVKLDADGQTIEKFEIFPAIQPNAEAFSAIRKGMNVFEVVEAVGVPFQSVTHGISSSDFKGTDGTIFRVQWDQNMQVIDMGQVNPS